MDLSRMLAHYQPEAAALRKLGFRKKQGVYTWKQTLSGALEARFTLTAHHFAVQVFDPVEGEAYLPFEQDGATGNFVQGIREQVDQLVQKIITQGCTCQRQREQLLAYVKKEYGTDPWYPWPEYPEHCPLKVPETGKWYGIVMEIPARLLGLPQPGEVDILNVKLPPDQVEALCDRQQFFPAYHMHKKYWLTMLLDGSVPLARVEQLVAASYALVAKKRSKRK
ncbi:MAG: MmcQ/YjbR family DNA-binding protein [Acidaminococcaceae bacterium]|jgi:predicted DNA-binding protein (MmcQ/YjbR family)|nr:MmcQ/YjbR family DNA-binding protein [Acidaminococcaceae bacterium]